MADNELIWVLSNRVDDRVAFSEQDPAHPGGWAVVGGDGPERIARTPRAVGALREGVIIEIAEPQDGPRKPLPLDAPGAAGEPPDMPGRVARLGRKLPEGLLAPADEARAAKAQAAAPDEVPVPAGVVVPPDETERTSTRRK